MATLVLRIRKGLEAREGWPADDLLERCGARIQRTDAPRVVEIGGKRFVEGYLESEIRQRADDGFEALGRGRPNETKRLSFH